MKTLIKRNPIRDQRGSSLIEVMLSIALLGILVVGFLSAIGTGSMAIFMTDERQTAKNLAESQMEYIKGLPFSASYSANDEIMAEYPGYSVEIDVKYIAERDENIQEITVIINDADGEPIAQLKGYKTKR